MKLKYVHGWRDRKTGRRYYFFRRRGVSIRLDGEYGSPEFMGLYYELLGFADTSTAITGAYENVRAELKAGTVQADERSVYFVKIGKFIKIGFTTNINERLKSFRGASAEPISLLHIVPGSYALEKELHRLFATRRIRNEFFIDDAFFRKFFSIAKQESISAAVQWVESKLVGRLKRRKNAAFNPWDTVFQFDSRRGAEQEST